MKGNIVMQKKFCLNCGSELDNNRKKYCCSDCAKEGQRKKAKEWRDKNQDKIKQWRKDNKDELCSYMREYMREYYQNEKNKQKQLNRMAEYRKKIKGDKENEQNNS